jgi:hypothetical protein
MKPTLLVLLLFAAIPAQTQTPAAPPIGHWVAEHPSNGGIGSWWDFRPDGTFTMHIGAMVTAPVKHTGNTLTMPSGTVGGAPVTVEFRVDGDKLHLKPAGAPEQTFTREGPAPSPTDPLLGKWHPALPATLDSDLNRAALQKATANGLYVFSADGTQSVRIPFAAREGTWSPSAHTFQFKGEPAVYSFGASGEKLLLGQAPDNKKTDTYLPDPIL